MTQQPVTPTSKPTPLFHDPTRDSRWRARFAAQRYGFPMWALDAPDRALYTCNTGGACEIHVWDRVRNTHRQVTRRASGTSYGALSADGEWIWWFADTDGDEFGEWMIEPFEPPPDSGPPVAAAPAIPPGYPTGLALGRTIIVVGMATDVGSTVWIIRPGHGPAVLRAYDADADVLAMSHDERLVAVATQQAVDDGIGVEILSTATGAPVATRPGGLGSDLDALAFSPMAGDHRLLLRRTDQLGTQLTIWDIDTGTETDVRLDLPGDITAQWYPRADALLVTSHHQARSTLHRYEMSSRHSSPLPTPPGTIDAAATRPDGTIEYLWSSSEQPPIVRTRSSDADSVLFDLPGDKPPPGPRLEDVWVDTPAGRLHLLLARLRRDPALPTVFLIHGGPHAAAYDRYSAYRSVWADAGLAVIQVNYRGSTGYGTAWEHAIRGRPALTELEDIAAALEWAISSGVADPVRCVIAGSSWGGCLALLALGVQPHRWAAGIAESPIADHAAAYADRPDFLQSFDRGLFGGSPAEQPKLYAEASPISDVHEIRAPVLLVVGDNDIRCPARQVETYAQALRDAGVPHQVHRYEAGHGTLVVDELIRQAALEVRFVADALGLDLSAG
jgi:dipeptidyl aminopeptidase/acylaminoacyl peptidase